MEAWGCLDRHMGSVGVRPGLEPMSVCSPGRPLLHQDAGLQPRRLGPLPLAMSPPRKSEAWARVPTSLRQKRREPQVLPCLYLGFGGWARLGLLLPKTCGPCPCPALPRSWPEALGAPPHALADVAEEASSWPGPWAAGGLGVQHLGRCG